MTPPEVKDYASTCSCPACIAITDQDLYISHQSAIGSDWREITVKYGPKPCQCGCGVPVAIGQKAMQKTGVGVRHADH